VGATAEQKYARYHKEPGKESQRSNHAAHLNFLVFPALAGKTETSLEVVQFK
jgi:hypothetical protein